MRLQLFKRKVNLLQIARNIVILLVLFGSLYISIGNIVVIKYKEIAAKSNVLYRFFRFVPVINLGLDIQGGSQMILTVDFDKFLQEKNKMLAAEIRHSLRNEKIKYTIFSFNEEEKVISFFLVGDEVKEVKKMLSNLDPDLSCEIGENKSVKIYYNRQVVAKMHDSVMDKSLTILRNRIDHSGTKEISLQRFGYDKIILQVPGVEDPEKLKKMLGRTAKLSFHILDHSKPFTDNPNEFIQDGMMIAPAADPNLKLYYRMNQQAEIDGDALLDAKESVDNFQAIVSFRFNASAGRKFAQLTSDNVGRYMAVVLDGAVLTAPVIREPILSGSGNISGKFDIDEARELAKLLRSGALPAQMKVVEERTIGPSVGESAIKSAKIACITGVMLVIIFMVAKYRLLGMVASVAILINLSLAVSVMAIFNFTLTLSGMAGLILTLGMSVDANVLIYERMRDEIMAGNKKNHLIILQGFKGAWSAIVDSNITTIFSAASLVAFGSGFIRGFSVSLIVGIMCSMFSAILLSRIIIERIFVGKNRVININ